MMETSGRGGDQVSASTAKDGVERRMKMKMKVMVAIDESEGSFYALKWALHNLFTPMAAVGAPTPDSTLQGHAGVVLLVHVQPIFHHRIFPLGPGGTALYTTPAVMDSVNKAQERISATVMSRALKICKDKLVKAESIIMNGDPREMICQTAEQMHVDLLIMGSRGLGKLKRTMEAVAVGGGGDQVSEGTAEDMGMERRMQMKVMVAIDDSDGSFYALKWALDNLFATMATVGSATPEATLRSVGMVFLVHVQPRFHEYGYPVGPGGTAFYTTSAVVDSVRKAQEEISAAILSRALQMCKEKLVKTETIILTGDPREMICQAAEQVHADLLVVGSRGLGTLSRTFLGSVSDYCAHHAKSPVLIVKPPMEDSEKQ